MNTTPTDPLLVDEREAERLLGLRPRTLAARRLRRQPVPPHLKFARRIRYMPDQLRAWIAAQVAVG